MPHGILRERKQDEMKTYRITLDITSETNPQEWNWDNFLMCDIEETYEIHAIQEIKNHYATKGN